MNTHKFLILSSCLALFVTFSMPNAMAQNLCLQLFSESHAVNAFENDRSLNFLEKQLRQQINRGIDEGSLKVNEYFKQSLGDAFGILSMHPGISSRAEIFVEFVLERRLLGIKMTPAFAAKAFREHLGKITLFRALLLSTSEFEQIKLHGIVPNLIRAGTSESEALVRIAQTGYRQAVHLHLDPLTVANSPFHSFTQVSDLSRWVVVAPPEGKKRRFVFEVKIDLIDAVYLKFDQSSKLLEEGIFWGTVLPNQISNLNSVKPEVDFYRFSPVDIMSEMREMRKRDYSAPKEQWPINY